MATPSTSTPAGQAPFPEPNAPEDLSRKVFLITVIGAAVFIGVAMVFVIG